MKKDLTHQITFAGILLAIIIVMQIIKNVNAFISGPVINACMVLAALCIGVWWGVGFAIGVPLLSLLIASASPMTSIAYATYGVATVIVIVGNLIFILSAYFTRKLKIYYFIPALIIGAVLKWLFMWGGGSLILHKLFIDSLGKLINAVNKIFSTLQLFSGLISVPLIVLLYEIEKKYLER